MKSEMEKLPVAKKIVFKCPYIEIMEGGTGTLRAEMRRIKYSIAFPLKKGDEILPKPMLGIDSFYAPSSLIVQETEPEGEVRIGKDTMIILEDQKGKRIEI